MNISTFDVAVLIAALASAVITIVGWRKTYDYQKKLWDVQEQRSYDRSIQAENRATIDKLLALIEEICARYSVVTSNRRQGVPSLEEERVLNEKVVEIRPLYSKVTDMVNRYDKKGEAKQSLENIVLSLCGVAAGLCVAVTGSEQYGQTEETAEVSRAVAEARRQIQRLLSLASEVES